MTLRAVADPVNIVCMRWGTRYPAVYVNRLYEMVQRRLKKPFNFYCITDEEDELLSGVQKIAMPQMPAASDATLFDWCKLGVFSPDMPFKGQVLFLDLDVVLLDNIDCFFQYKGQFRIIESWSQPGKGIGDAAVFCFDAGKHHGIFEAYMQDSQDVMTTYDSAQHFLSVAVGQGRLHYWPSTWCRNFKRHCLSKWLRFREASFPYAAKVLVFSGNPKPHHAIEGAWPGLLPARMKPVSWLESYWGQAPRMTHKRRRAS
jgi:hypothetical protein